MRHERRLTHWCDDGDGPVRAVELILVVRRGRRAATARRRPFQDGGLAVDGRGCLALLRGRAAAHGVGMGSASCERGCPSTKGVWAQSPWGRTWGGRGATAARAHLGDRVRNASATKACALASEIGGGPRFTVMWRCRWRAPAQRGSRDEKRACPKTRGGGALPRAKSTAKSEAKIRVSCRTAHRPLRFSGEVCRSAAAARRRPRERTEKPHRRAAAATLRIDLKQNDGLPLRLRRARPGVARRPPSSTASRPRSRRCPRQPRKCKRGRARA